MHSVTKIIGGLCASLVLASAGIASAKTPAQPAAVATERTAAIGAAGSDVMSLDELASLSGGTGVANAITDQDLVAINHDNSVIGQYIGSGDISLNGEALRGFDGIGNFVMNTGHNNNLQSTLSVTILTGLDP